MMGFDWRDATDAPLERRFDAAVDVVGRNAWAEFVHRLTGWRPAAEGDHPRALLSAFIRQARAEQARTPPPRHLFVSHRQSDVEYAERLAFDAVAAGHDYWLDVHDPWLPRVPPSDPRYPVLIAAIIEMALINATHLVLAATPWIAGSHWVPYEYGRAKDPGMVSVRVACWMHPRFQPAAAGEYLRLGAMLPDEAAVDGWMHAMAPAGTGAATWRGSRTPDPLDVLARRDPR